MIGQECDVGGISADGAAGLSGDDGAWIVGLVLKLHLQWPLRRASPAHPPANAHQDWRREIDADADASTTSALATVIRLKSDPAAPRRCLQETTTVESFSEDGAGLRVNVNDRRTKDQFSYDLHHPLCPLIKSPLTNTTSTAAYAAHAPKISARRAWLITNTAPANMTVNSTIKPSVRAGLIGAVW